MFKLKRPCANCPFKIGVGSTFRLHRERLDDIFEGPAFQCHKTVDYSGGHDEGLPGDRPQQCAGLMAVLIREGQPNQIMQLAFRLRKLVADEVDPDGEAYRSIADAISAHGGKEPA